MAKIQSTEDTALNSVALVTNRKRVYSDIDLTFARNTANDDDIFKKKDAAAVKQAVKNLILTNEAEKPFRPRFGANLAGMLFELVNDEDVEEDIRERIYDVIEQYEPRATVEDLEVFLNEDQNRLNVKLKFRILNIDVIDTLEITVTRFR